MPEHKETSIKDAYKLPPHTKRCKCGVLMQFAINKATGAKIPLDTEKRAYIIIDPATEERPAVVDAIKGCFVSHFQTCPNAREFSRKREMKS